jgi:hypothetical protein
MFNLNGTAGRRIAGLVLATTVAAGMSVTDQASASAASDGQHNQAWVQCDYAQHTMRLTAAASPEPGYTTQTVYYRYWLWDLTDRGWVPANWPTAWAQMTAMSMTVNAFGATVIFQGPTSSPTWTFPVNPHLYTVWVEYAWLESNGSFSYSTPAQSQNYEETGLWWTPGNGFLRHDYCIA